MRHSLICCLLLLMTACSEDVPRPPVNPLDASEAELQTLYKWGPGPWSVAVIPELQLAHPEREEPLIYNAWFPQGMTEPAPVLLFSHGNWSDFNQYDALINHWVSHGYVVVAPLHRDGGGGYLSGTVDMIRYGNLGLIQMRARDLVVLLDQMDQVQARLSQESVQLDTGKIAATGHSFGAFNAQQLGGARALDTDTGDYLPMDDTRVRAVVAISPPGPMFDEITAESWKTQALPTLLTTGTWDTNPVFWPDWRLHKMSWETAQPGDQYALVVQGMDHYLGNLICRLELEEAPQQDALNMVNTLVIAFLDAQLKDSKPAREFLESSTVNAVSEGFAVVERR